MRGMTKAECLTFEKLATAELTKVLGEPNDFFGDKSCLEWFLPHGRTGKVRIHLICDSVHKGNMYRSSWIASRITDERLIDSNGYTKNQSDIEGGWPFPFTYPSGKCNLHPDKDDKKEKMYAEIAHYLYMIAATGSKEKTAFGLIEFSTEF